MNDPIVSVVKKLARVEGLTDKKKMKFVDHKVCRVPPAKVSDLIDAETLAFFLLLKNCYFFDFFPLGGGVGEVGSTV